MRQTDEFFCFRCITCDMDAGCRIALIELSGVAKMLSVENR